MKSTLAPSADQAETLSFTARRNVYWKGRRYHDKDPVEATEAETLVEPFSAWIAHGWVERKGAPAAAAPAAPPATKNGREQYEVLQQIAWRGVTRSPGDIIDFAPKGSHSNRDRWLKAGKIRKVVERPTLEEALGLTIGDLLRGRAEGNDDWIIENWYPHAEGGPILRLLEAHESLRGGLPGKLGIPVRNPAREGNSILGDVMRAGRCTFEIIAAQPRTSADAEDPLEAKLEEGAPPQFVLMSRAEMDEIQMGAAHSLSAEGKKKAPVVRAFQANGKSYVATGGVSNGEHGYFQIDANELLAPDEVDQARIPAVRDWRAGRLFYYGRSVTVKGRPAALGEEVLRVLRRDCKCDQCRDLRTAAEARAAKLIPQTPSAEVVEAILHERIDRSHYNPREDFDATPKAAAAFAGLVESVRAQGIIQPLIVTPTAGRPGYYSIVAGERRWRAADRLGLETVPCIVRTLAKVKLLEQQALENLQRQNLNAVEEGQQYKTLRDEGGLTVPVISKRTGISEPTIYSRIKLLELPPGIRKAVISGRLKPTIADLVAREEDYDFQCACMDAILFPDATENVDEESSGPAVLSFRGAKAWINANREPFLANADWKKRQRDSHRFNDAAKVLSIEESNAALWPGGNVRETQEWVRPGDPCFDDTQKRTFEQLAEAGGVTLPAPVLARDPDRGGPVVLLPRGGVETALAAKFPEVGAAARRQVEQEEQRQRDRAEASRVRAEANAKRGQRAKDVRARCAAGLWIRPTDEEAFLRYLVGGKLHRFLMYGADWLGGILADNGVTLTEPEVGKLDPVWIFDFIHGLSPGELRSWLLYFHLHNEEPQPGEEANVDEDQLIAAEVVFPGLDGPRTFAVAAGKEVAV